MLQIAHLGSLEYWRKFGSHLLSRRIQNVVEPMDEAFRDRLLPVLMHPWQDLERLEIKGVNRRILPASLERLNGVDVVFDEEVLPCWNAEAER